ncbi:MAG: putative hydroxymethylpyrimidine transporter CytX [Veillonella sp.]|uniref:putative hydroxymethylpyrimidine transporter CytX n=1 Tax=Veillonella sp. TaxID=1926307 RepID=UPI0025CE75F7|nr:putative hydroxymethylpyrimidine transporter CytX [Veillonella sp.]MBS4913053.1 putative hydroxymethylpyrimidine transporter CytX [Veillonella sp.]
MRTKRTGLFSYGFLWFGAALSMAEIFTGTILAPLGFTKALAAIILGHIIGGSLLFLAGVIGGQTRHSAMESVRIAFGQRGASFFAIANILQLIGWATVMIITGSAAAQSIHPLGTGIWAAIIGAIIILWLFVSPQTLTKMNTVAMSLLFLLALWLSSVIITPAINLSGPITTNFFNDDLSFGAAVELAAAMPISYLPLISDYTRNAKRPVAAAGVSTVTYCVISAWMYVIGLSCAIYTGENDIVAVMANTGIGVFPLLIIVFSTVATTYLDSYSSGVSVASLFPKAPEKITSIIVTILSVCLAIIVPMTEYEEFLFLIGSIFTPMIAILFSQYFLLKNDATGSAFNMQSIILWIIGFVLYRSVLTFETPLGTTFPVMITIALLTYIVGRITGKRNTRYAKQDIHEKEELPLNHL